MQAVPDLSALFDGVPDGGLSVGEGGSVRPWRLPVADLDLFVPTQGNAHHASSSNGILVQAANSSGVRIVLSSDTDRLRMVVQPRFVYSGAVFDLVADNVLLSTQACPPEKTYTPDPSLDQMTAMQEMFKQMQEWSALDAQPLTVEFEGIAAAGAERLELWLPHRATVTILSLEVASGAAVAPVKDLRPRWITHGSSITHCAEAHSPARTWPATAARLADVRLYSLGFGGQCHFDQAVARVIRDEPADCISLKYALASASYILPNLSLKGDLIVCCMGRRLGINTHNLASLSNRTFATAALGFVLTVRDGHPTTPLVLISPIFGSWREEIPAGANNVEEMPQPGAAAWPVRRQPPAPS